MRAAWAIAKRELRSFPVVGHYLAGRGVLIDRKAGVDAKQAIEYFAHKDIQLPEVTTFRPGEPVKLELAYRNVKACDTKVYRIDLMKFSLLIASTSLAVEPVNAKLAKESAWTGEAVPLMITLYSPGPFSGTASFDFPDLPLTAIIRGGSPVVGSESIDDETYFTQRHELTIYTQRGGDIIIPAFRVRFSGKKTFTSDPEPTEGTTPELRFESKRPPGTESMGLVICATTMQAQQTWNPEPTGEIQAGDVIVRTIVRKAEGTTAMMLPDVAVSEANVLISGESGTGKEVVARAIHESGLRRGGPSYDLLRIWMQVWITS